MKAIILALCCLTSISPCWAKMLTVQEEVQLFKKNPKRYITQKPKKYSLKIRPSRTNYRPYSQIKKSNFVQQKINNRKAIQDRSLQDPPDLGLFSEYQANDNFKNLVDNKNPLKSLKQIDSAHLQSSQLVTSPWSGHYWPYYMGTLSARYFDRDFYQIENWNELTQYIKEHSFKDIYAEKNSEKINRLSVAEKIDLYLNPEASQFSTYLWAQSQGIFDDKGEIEAWMGLCHGWAPGSFMVPRPKHIVQLTAADGITPIVFYPDEIKGLVTYVWANSAYETRYIGGRCNKADPEVDENGRIIEPSCNDTNPATWHLSVVNQIGVAKRSFVMDATYDLEVWNQPVLAYQYNYFNPNTSEGFSEYQDAVINLSDYQDNPFKTRSEKAKKIVGVSMLVGYVSENQVEPAVEDSPDRDEVVWVQYLYDLELDDHDNVVGGEWYTNFHPDFLWVPAVNAKAYNYFDIVADLTNWMPNQPLSPDIRNIMTQATRYGGLLGRFVEKLVNLSQGEELPEEAGLREFPLERLRRDLLPLDRIQ